MPTDVPFRRPLPDSTTLWVDEYWRTQPVELSGLRVDDANQIHVDYEFRTPAGTFNGHLATPPVLFDPMEGPHVAAYFATPRGITDRQFEPIWQQLLEIVVDWKPDTSHDVPWHDPLPEVVVADLDDDRSIKFTEIVVRDDRISARYEITGDIESRSGRIRTPRVLFQPDVGPDFYFSVQLIDGLDEETTDAVHEALLFDLVHWEHAFAAEPVWKLLTERTPAAVQLVSLSVWQEGQLYGVDPDKPWWRSITYTDRTGGHKVAVDGPGTQAVIALTDPSSARWHPPVRVHAGMTAVPAPDAADAAMLELLRELVDPEALHEQHFTDLDA